MNSGILQTQASKGVVKKGSKSFRDHMIGYPKYAMKDMMLSDLV